MTTNWNAHWAARTSHLKASAIRELLKLTSRPEVISFAGGLPATETLPIQAIAEACDRIFASKADKALQYGPTEGYMGLREQLAAQHRSRGVPATAENILVTTGSQQGLDLVGRALIDHGDRVVTEGPTYIGALQAWQTSAPVIDALPLDRDGMRIDLLNFRRPFNMMYVLPNFQNPTGVTMSYERRCQIVEMAHRYDFIVLEDDPYRALRYSGKDLPALVEIEAEMLGSRWNEDSRVVHLGTFSKVMAPGLRVGWILAPTEALRMFVLAKQGADLHSSTLTQYIADDLLREGTMQANMPMLIEIYRERRDTMLSAMGDYMSDLGTWTHPEGGLFIWLTLNDLNTQDMMVRALERNVAYVPGSNFYADGSGTESMRLNFSSMPPVRIREGIARLGALIEEEHGQHLVLS